MADMADGYEAPVRTGVLEFEDGDLKGLELTVKMNLGFGPLFRLIELQGIAVKSKGLEAEQEMLALFAEKVVLGWNLQMKGQPVPYSPSVFLDTLDPRSMGIAVMRYVQEVGSVSGPLPPRSASGGRSARRQASKRRQS